MTAFVKRSVSSVQSASSLSFSSLVFSSPSRREAATKQRVTNRLLTVKSASGKTYSQLAAETGLKRRTSWESRSYVHKKRNRRMREKQELLHGVNAFAANMFTLLIEWKQELDAVENTEKRTAKERKL